MIGTSDEGLLLYNNRTGAFRPYFIDNEKFRAIPIVRARHKDRHGTIWVGTDGDGLLKISNPTADTPKSEQFVKHNQIQSSLSSNAIYSVFVDNEFNTWIGTAWNGINILEQKAPSIRHYYSDFNGENPSPYSLYSKREATCGLVRMVLG